MATLTIRMPDDKAERLKIMAEQRNISVNKLMEEMATYAIASFDTESRFRARAARGSAQRGLAILDELDSYYRNQPSAPSHGLHEPEVGSYNPEPPKTPASGRKKHKK